MLMERYEALNAVTAGVIIPASLSNCSTVVDAGSVNVVEESSSVWVALSLG